MDIINIYIIDNSPMTAGRMVKGMGSCVGIKVVGCGSNNEYMKKAAGLKVDAIILNTPINLNIKNFISYVSNTQRIPCIALTNNQNEASEALISGAEDCITKTLNIIDEHTFKMLAERVRNAYMKKKTIKPGAALLNGNSGVKNLTGVIAIGASTGGTEATLEVLKKLPKRIPGIVVTQHMMDKFIGIYAERLNRLCSLEVSEAKDGDIISPGRVLIAPGDRHMAVKKIPHGYAVRCFKGKLVSGHCPSVDVLFDSMADAVGRDGVGIILTGMGEDGARGLKKMRDKGAYTIGQSQDGCCVYGMPQRAYELGGVTVQRALHSISNELVNYLKKR